MNTKHTPGPWRVREDSVVLIHEIDWSFSAGNEANARLIAAAPELYDELNGAISQLNFAAECIEAGRYDEALLHCRSMMRTKLAAIAKATGGGE